MNPMLISNCNTDRKRVIRLRGKVIGVIEGNTFTKSVHGSKHQVRSPPAWAIDADIFDNEIQPNCTQILIVDRETNKRYRTSVDTFDNKKKEIERGYGKQYLLTLNHWNIEIDGEIQLGLWE
jgi:hypothetical protein